MKVEKSPLSLIYPSPIVLVTCLDSGGKPNIITLTRVGTVCYDPPIVGLGIGAKNYSYRLIEETGEFVVNIPTVRILKETDYCGLISGRDVDKFTETHLTPEPASKVKPPLIKECPLNLECVLKQKIKLGTNDLFLGEVILTHIEEEILDDKGRIDLNRAAPFVFNLMGIYYKIGREIAQRGFSKTKDET